MFHGRFNSPPARHDNDIRFFTSAHSLDRFHANGTRRPLELCAEEASRAAQNLDEGSYFSRLVIIAMWIRPDANKTHAHDATGVKLLVSIRTIRPFTSASQLTRSLKRARKKRIEATRRTMYRRTCNIAVYIFLEYFHPTHVPVSERSIFEK